MYLDDTTLGENPNSVYNDVMCIEKKSHKVGLELNYGKFKIFLFVETAHKQQAAREKLLFINESFRFPAMDGFSFLGSPFIDEAVAKAVADKMTLLEKFGSRLGLLEVDLALFSLKNCVAVPKVLYMLSTSETWKFPTVLKKFDDVVKKLTVEICNIPIGRTIWLQASLPVQRSGLGMRWIKLYRYWRLSPRRTLPVQYCSKSLVTLWRDT